MSESDRLSFTLRHDERPFTTNAERRMHPMQRAGLVRKWRQAFCMLALEEKIPLLENVSLDIVPYLRDHRGVQDTAACNPAAKAACDGLIDAGVLEDDGPSIVVRITFHAPAFGEGDGLEMTISGDPVTKAKKLRAVASKKVPYRNKKCKIPPKKPDETWTR